MRLFYLLLLSLHQLDAAMIFVFAELFLKMTEDRQKSVAPVWGLVEWEVIIVIYVKI
jgi:hypothetical protein